MEKCICCEKNEVTWPRVCDECKDHEAQEELHNAYIETGLRDYVKVGPFEEIWDWVGGECRTCGMLYDGGTRCTYCGDENPWE